MSSSQSSSSAAIAIPRRRRRQHFLHSPQDHGPSSSSGSSSTDHAQPPRQAAESPATRSTFGGESMSMTPKSLNLGKEPMGTGLGGMPSPVAAHEVPAMDRARRRGSSFLSESLARSEYTVVDIGSEDCPRLITCVKASQGFDWNQELFLPSYIDYDFENLERRAEPVQDIIVTDEEAAKFFPQ